MFNQQPAERFWTRHVWLTLGLGLFLCLLTPLSLLAQSAEESAKAPRKLVYKVEAEYPLDLQRARIGGVVRLDVLVTPKGTPDKISVVGGNPILVETAIRAVKKWKWAAADSGTTVRVNVLFDSTR